MARTSAIVFFVFAFCQLHRTGGETMAIDSSDQPIWIELKDIFEKSFKHLTKRPSLEFLYESYGYDAYEACKRGTSIPFVECSNGELKTILQEEHKKELASDDFLTRYMELAQMVAIDGVTDKPDPGEACVDPNNAPLVWSPDIHAYLPREGKGKRQCFGPLEKPLDDKFKLPKGNGAGYIKNGKHAVIVLGPSAAGKTTTTLLALKGLLEFNKWCPNLQFTSIDGGLIREASPHWYKLKEAVKETCTRKNTDEKQYCNGAKDLYGTLEAAQKAFKMQLLKDAIAEGTNLIFPDTATGGCEMAGMDCGGSVNTVLDRLSEAGYSTSILMIYADKESCRRNAMGEYEIGGTKYYNLVTARDVNEGKRYSDSGYGWALKGAANIFEHVYDKGIGYSNMCAVLDNNDFKRSTEDKMDNNQGVGCSHFCNVKQIIVEGSLMTAASDKATFKYKGYCGEEHYQSEEKNDSPIKVCDEWSTIKKERRTKFKKSLDATMSARCPTPRFRAAFHGGKGTSQNP